MKAMIFAAGLGTRLKPFTDFHPKALAEVCGRPMLGVVIERLKMAGISEIIVNVHHFADQIVDYLHRNNDFGVRLHISDETSELLDTGGGILAARRWLDGDEPFVVHNADILTDVDIAGMLSVARSTGAASTLLVASRVTKRYLLFDPSISRPVNTDLPDSGCPINSGNLHSGACMLFRLRFFPLLQLMPRPNQTAMQELFRSFQ